MERIKIVLLVIFLFGTVALKAQIPSSIKNELKNNLKVLSLDFEQHFYPNGSLESEGMVFF